MGHIYFRTCPFDTRVDKCEGGGLKEREKRPLNRSLVVCTLDGLKCTLIHARTHTYTPILLFYLQRRVFECRKAFDDNSGRSEDDCRRGFSWKKYTRIIRPALAKTTTRVLRTENRNRPVVGARGGVFARRRRGLKRKKKKKKKQTVT